MKIAVTSPSESKPWRDYLAQPEKLIIGALVLLTLLIYSPVLENDFVDYDDPGYVTDNSVVKRGLTLAGIGWAFRSTELGN